MTGDQLLSMLGQGGVVAVLLFILGRVIWRVGERMVKAIDLLAVEISSHTKIDLEHHGSVKEQLAELRGRIDMLAEWTPVETPIPRETSRRYHIKRSRTEPGEDK